LPGREPSRRGTTSLSCCRCCRTKANPIFQRYRWAAASASSSCSTSIIISLSLSVAACEENGQTPCGRSRASPLSAPPLSAAEAAETLPDRGGVAPAAYTMTFFGRWSRRGAWEGRLVGGGSHSGGWKAGERRVLGWIFSAKRGRERFSNVARGASAPDRVLPRRGWCGSTGCLFGIERAPARIWGHRCGRATRTATTSWFPWTGALSRWPWPAYGSG
jgi:hypothetical protein